jgi:segregation and condensation protein A
VAAVPAALPERESLSFRQLVAGAPSQLEAIVRFLAVLELFKQGVVDLEQVETFGELRVRRLREGETALDAASLAEWDEPPDDDGASARETDDGREPVGSEPE